MTATIDSAGRLVIPKALRDRAGLTPGTRVDYHFHDGNIAIGSAYWSLLVQRYLQD